MKKYPFIAGLGLLATCGAVFAAWSFGYTPTNEIDDSLPINIGVDTDWDAIGMHGTLALESPTEFKTVQIVQNDAKNSAKFNYAGSDVYTLKYTAPTDGNPDPETFNFTVNATVTSNLDVVSEITVSSAVSTLTISNASDTASVSVSDLLGKITFGTIDTEAKADAFIAAVKAVKNPTITFTFAAAAA